MPYLRLSSLPLDDETKRHLADELTSTVLDILPDEKPEWTSVHFTPFQPDEFAIAGRLVADGAIADTHLEISAPVVDEKRWFALRNRLTDVLIEALSIPESERWHVNVKLNRYDAHSFAVAGNASDELEDARHATALLPEDLFGEERQRGKPGWRRPSVLVGFVAGAVLTYRWLTDRLRSDATVDAAPPIDNTTPPASGSQSAATPTTASGSTTDAGPREY